MRRFCTSLLLLVLSSAAEGQSRTMNVGGIPMQLEAADSSLTFIFCKVGVMPTFPGGSKALVAFAKSNITYPDSAVEDEIQGTVTLEFMIDTTGKVIGKKIVQSVRYDIDSACLQMLNLMPDWEPGMLDNKPIDVTERWSIIFRLEDDCEDTRTANSYL